MASLNDDGTHPMQRDASGRPMPIDPLVGSQTTATVTLTNAQIKTLPTTPVQIVAAPGANKVIVPLYGLCHSEVSVAYNEAAADAALRLEYASGGNPASGLLPINLFAALDLIGGFPALATAETFYDPDLTGLAVSASGSVNRGLVVKEHWVGSGAFTDGDDANTMTITVAYVVLDV